ncbi:MAG: potassium-transporting ATPase potassium-binding subunit [Dehalococcoidia bacterium]|nr:MAG: potassium-transporting ATPase potassium-binding subunit [Dehalococcoidia bacterium]
MTFAGALQLLLFLAALALLTKPLGLYLEQVFTGGRTWLSPLLAPLERAIYRLSGIDPQAEQRWTQYATALLLFSLVSMLALYALQRLQSLLPFNPQGFGPVAPELAFNTAASFTTNTNWQAYSGESTMSYFTQMAGLTFHNFVSAASGLAVALAFIRGLARRSVSTLGNFWVDLVRATLYVLLPMSVGVALLLVWQGVPQNLSPAVEAVTLEGEQQLLAQGPVASQEVIKLLGTNGGGFFNANSAHPYENPTPLSNFLETLLILALPSALTYTFGRFVGDTRQGWAVWAAMLVLFLAGLALALPSELAGNPLLTQLGVDQAASPLQPGGNFEGKEVRFGTLASVLFAVVTTATSCGAVNASHSSFLPLAGAVPLFNMQLGEVIFGGVGTGLVGMLVFALLAVFIAGLMVGRTPEYLGKKIERFEMQMVMLYLLAAAATILVLAAWASVSPEGTGSILNPGPHGLSEILYAFSSATANNGSAFAGLNANTPFYNLTLGVAMLIGRFFLIVPVLALAGALARKPRVPPSLGTFPTTGPLFVSLLVGTVLVVGALTFFPALALGPVVEQLLLTIGQTF